MSINSRISELIEYLGDTENSFSKRLGASSSAIFNIVNPKGRMSYPSGVVLEKILAIEIEGRVSAEWLMRGEGAMILGEGMENNNSAQLLGEIRSLASRFDNLEKQVQSIDRK